MAEEAFRIDLNVNFWQGHEIRFSRAECWENVGNENSGPFGACVFSVHGKITRAEAPEPQVGLLIGVLLLAGLAKRRARRTLCA